ncbi:hypothetical protein Q4F19_09040 [Sphingomonas sp. BIUV-7]|uniref:PRC-barrel domain-containing protein n=1 Tax=Sphingomonas natans TaxID=3063330 RepID=A0ABT8Y9Z0_9SPHN|nr:hypothetical protein [Sphingomonas sp. BIUV-7]MDO6414524.1 hypothetical protein [Sphingomonas sp. BIUV-7]
MKISAALALALAVCAVPASAQEAAPSPSATNVAVSQGATIFTADGRRVGRIDRVRGSSVSVIYAGKFIEIPISTLSAGDNGLKTSLAKADLAKL